MTYKGKGLTPEQLERAKCPMSPVTKVHHWMLPSTAMHHHRDRGVGQCKYCGERRRFCLSWPMTDVHPHRELVARRL